MTSFPVRDQINDHLPTPKNAGMNFIDCQPTQARAISSMDLRLLVDTKADYDAARPDMDKALWGANFRTLDSSMEIYRGSPVIWTA